MSEHAIANAKAWLETIAELVARANNDGEDNDAAREEIYEAPLSVAVRSGWYSPGAEPAGAEEYEILLSTGGPALRIVGDLDRGYPETARLQWQDWGTPWTDHETTHDDDRVIQSFAAFTYFGE